MAELLQGLIAAKALIGWIMQQAAILSQKGEMSPAELQAIKDRAGFSDAAWDEAVEDARRRIAASGGD